jgi:hypothetical protein
MPRSSLLIIVAALFFVGCETSKQTRRVNVPMPAVRYSDGDVKRESSGFGPQATHERIKLHSTKAIPADRLNINYGAAANDGSGDNLRTFTSKANSNFVELYANLTTVSNLAASGGGGGAPTKMDTNNGTSYSQTAIGLSNKLSGASVFRSIDTRFTEFNILDYGAVAGGADIQSALSNAIVAASAVGGVVKIPEASSPFNLSTIDITASNFRLEGKGTIQATGVVTNWIKLTGTNIGIKGPKLDGLTLAQTVLIAGAYSSDWIIEQATIKNARITDANDPLNTVLTGSATAVGFKMLTGVKRIKVLDNYFLNIGYDGLKNAADHGNGRCARAILGTVFPATSTEADAITDIDIAGNFFINTDADKSLVDADAICFQGNTPGTFPNSRIHIERNYIDYWGWRGGKFQVSGVKLYKNRVVSRSPQAYGVTNGVDNYLRTMGNGFLLQGSNNDVSYNWFEGTSMGSPIMIQSTDTAGFGQHTNNIISFNTMRLDGSLQGLVYNINLESVASGQIVGNEWNSGYHGIILRGDCKNWTLAANRGASNVFSAIYLLAENQSNSWTNMSPSDITIMGTVVEKSAAWGVNAAAGTNITVIGTTGTAASGLVTFGGSTTGTRVGNKGSVEPLRASTANDNYYLLLEAFADATLSAKMTGPFGNVIWSLNGGADRLTIGRAENRSDGAWGFNQNPDASAQVSINSTTKGFLLPRMTEAQRDAISSPTTGLTLSQSDGTAGQYRWNGSAWQKFLMLPDIDTSAELASILGDETGSGALVFAGGNIGAATATTPPENDNDTSVATTAYVQTEISGLAGTPAGSDTQVQFNDGGSFAGDSGLTFNKTSNALTVGGAVTASSFTGTGATADSSIALPDDDATHYFSLQAANTTTTSVNVIGPAAPLSGLLKSTVSATTNMTLAAAVADTDYVAPGGNIGAGTATTPSAGDDDTSIPTTAWVQDEIDATQTGTHASPSTANPLAPTWTGPLHTVWYGATGEIDLPAAASYTGKAILIYNTGAFTVTIDPNGSEVIVRDGTVQTGGVTFTLSSGAGNYVALYCDGTRWVTIGYKGTLAAGS